MKLHTLFRPSIWITAALIALLTWSFWPRAELVDLATVDDAELVQTLDEEGVTRVRERYVVASPLAATLARIEIEPGDPVEAGKTILARLLPVLPPVLDARAEKEALAALRGAEADVERALANQARAIEQERQARRDEERLRQLGEEGVASIHDAEIAATALLTLGQEVTASRAAVVSARAAREAARARVRFSDDRGEEPFELRSPADGRLLRRLKESETAVAVGEALVEIGDPTDLEIVADYLSTDAVRIEPGLEAWIEGWGGEGRLAARVRRVEPSGYIKISALGVEEQRVDVILDLLAPVAERPSLGDGYQVETRIVLWRGESVPQVPSGTLFRLDSGEGGWAVYQVVDGRVQQTPVEVGHRDAGRAEILAGLSVGDEVVLYPGEAISEGTAVRAR